MDLKFSVSAHIAKPVGVVFEAVADPGTLSRYFATGGANGRLETGATVTWDFHDFPGAFPVEVVEVVPNEKIVLKWEADSGLQASYGNCMGWSQMLCALRMWIEHGINLREGMYK